MGTLCQNEWIALLAVVVLVFSNWLSNLSMVNGGRVQRFYASYRLLRGTGRFMFFPPSWVFGVVWTTLYALIVPAIFIFYYYDDACTATGSYDYQVELATWILIIVNLLAIKSWDFAVGMQSMYKAAYAGAAVTAVAALTSIAITALLFSLAGEAGVSHNLYFSAVAYLLLSVWTCFATFLGFSQAMNTKTAERLLKERKP